jgi:enoyl-CoA hydratase/carnithine racemase
VTAGQVLLRRGAGEAGGEGAGIATLVIDNPAKYNAMSLSMWQALGTHLRALAVDPGVRVVVLRGAGEKAFVSGADISEFDTLRAPGFDGAQVYDDAVEEAQAALAAAPFPLVAQIHGVCMGGGLGLALACDLRYCAVNTRFRMPAARLGVGYNYNGIQQMVQALGGMRLADLFYTARTFDGTEAERIGLVHSACAPEVLDAEVGRLAGLVAENAPLSIRLAKAAIRFAQSSGQEPQSDARAADAIAAMRQRCIHSTDYAEGRLAFKEKRTPRFTGN